MTTSVPQPTHSRPPPFEEASLERPMEVSSCEKGGYTHICVPVGERCALVGLHLCVQVCEHTCMCGAIHVCWVCEPAAGAM